ncbi:Multiple epidermal growth factor-like domains protein 10 [Hypsibius exemplaris]|uniref:Multiple epidermal growth factor-like domains protein 10 n=1 Tax=Hypsibius exemplaris TaxID=2072580 RepID=A0A1W0WR17_HYPEX|nr:Multiple epidermal growth factor-like domains protein 10 [Hypsibius exemplaris]
MSPVSRSPSLFLVAFLFVITCCAVGGASAQDLDRELSGPNVCLKQELVTVTEMQTQRETEQLATTTWCLSIPPRCTTYKTVFKLKYVPKQVQKMEMVKRCCEGYTLHSNGTCVGCPITKWGPQCTKICRCQNGASCNPITGKCECADGWMGEMCGNPCPSGQYGALCLQQCRCENGALCDHVTGACKCQPGTCGPLCQKTGCETEGRVCERCQNGASCLGETDDKCACTPGWMGNVCASPCDEGYWGKNCSKPCKICYNHGKCNPINGNCNCPAGYNGDQCELQCEPGKWGADCQSACLCENGETCDPANGKCHCNKGYKGDRCESRGCPDGLFGQYCNNTCACSNATSCHPIDGVCGCKANWQAEHGSACTACCIISNKGPECYKDCGASAQKFLCLPELGGCVCLNDYTGPECRVIGLDASNAALHSTVVGKGDNTGLIVGLCLAVLVVCLILALALFYRRRVRKLQEELNSVAYSSSSNTDTESQSSSSHADNLMYLGGTGGGKTATAVVMKNGETFVKVAEPLPKKPQNTYVSMPNNFDNDRESIYQSIEYEVPTPRHQYASIEETALPPPTGHSNQAFENQLYNQSGGNLVYAPPSYQAVITETLSSTHPAK